MFCPHNLTSLLPESKEPLFPSSFWKLQSNKKKQTPEALKIKGSGRIVIIPTHLVLQKFVKKRCKTGA